MEAAAAKAAEAEAAAEVAEGGLPHGWAAVRDESGRTYYWHEETGATRWQRPSEAAMGGAVDAGEAAVAEEAEEPEEGEEEAEAVAEEEKVAEESYSILATRAAILCLFRLKSITRYLLL